MTSVSSAASRRYLALWLPYLSTDRIRRSWRKAGSGAPDEAPLVLFAKVEQAMRLTAVDPNAAALGLAPPLALADARARIPGLLALDADPAADAATLEEIADWCDRYTPLVALDGTDGIVLDVTGCVHLFGGEAALLADLSARLEGIGFATRAAVAGTPDTTRAVARYGRPGVVAPGGDEAAVRPFPVEALMIPQEHATALRRAGLKTVAALADRPWPPLAARFGEGLLGRLERTLGRRDGRITPRRALPSCIAERRFAEPALLLDGLPELLRGLAANLKPMLERRGEGGRRFVAGFYRSDGAVREILVETGRPSRDPDMLARLFDERLSALADPLDPGFGYDLIRLSVLVTEPMVPAAATLDGREHEDDLEAELVDRLVARLGAEQVTRFAEADTHIPEDASRSVPARAAVPWSKASAASGEPPLRPLHLFDPPQAIEALAEVPDGPPIRFRWRRVTYDIGRAEGPERIAPEWWRGNEEAPTRDYYRVEDAAGHRFWVFREGFYGRETTRWFLHGLFA